MQKKGILAFFALFYIGLLGVIAAMMIGAKYEYEWTRESSFPKFRSSVTIAEEFDGKLVLIAEKEMLVIDGESGPTKVELSYAPKSIAAFNDEYYLLRAEGNRGAILKNDSFDGLSSGGETVYDAQGAAYEFFLATETTLYAIGNAENGAIITQTKDGVNWTDFILQEAELRLSCGVMKGETMILGGVKDTDGAIVIVEDPIKFSEETSSVLKGYSSVKTMEVIEERLFIGCAGGKLVYTDDLKAYEESKIEIGNTFLIYDIVKYHERVFVITSSLPNAGQLYSGRVFYSEDSGVSFEQAYEENQRLFVGAVYDDRLYVSGETGNLGSVYTVYKMKEGIFW